MASLSEIEREYRERQAGKQKRYANANIEFKHVSEFDPAATEKNRGVPKYREYDLLIVTRLDGDVTPVKVEEWHKKEYPAQWEAFQKGLEQPVDGLALENWPMVSIEAIAQFKHYGFRTVEQVAELTDDIKKKLPPNLQAFCKKAKTWLESANSKQTEVSALKEQLAKQDKTIERLNNLITQLSQRIEATEGTRLVG